MVWLLKQFPKLFVQSAYARLLGGINRQKDWRLQTILVVSDNVKNSLISNIWLSESAYVILPISLAYKKSGCGLIG
jgi:hypothetical protein